MVLGNRPILLPLSAVSGSQALMSIDRPTCRDYNVVHGHLSFTLSLDCFEEGSRFYGYRIPISKRDFKTLDDGLLDNGHSERD